MKEEKRTLLCPTVVIHFRGPEWAHYRHNVMRREAEAHTAATTLLKQLEQREDILIVDGYQLAILNKDGKIVEQTELF